MMMKTAFVPTIRSSCDDRASCRMTPRGDGGIRGFCGSSTEKLLKGLPVFARPTKARPIEGGSYPFFHEFTKKLKTVAKRLFRLNGRGIASRPCGLHWGFAVFCGHQPN